MPNFQDRAQQAVGEEKFEFPIRGPFGGIQSELPPGSIETYGFNDILNLILRKGTATVRPDFTALTLMPNPQEPIDGIADFFDANGARHQMIITPTRLLQWSGGGPGSFTAIPGAAFTGPASAIFDWAVVNYKLLFSQGVDKVQVYDGIINSVGPASANAVAANHMFELNNYLIVLNTIEGGQAFPQRMRWTAPGDTTDWVSLSAGVLDLLNDLGPIVHGVKLFQAGYALQQFGITQIIPTGNGLNPFNLQPIASNNHGCPYPNSPAHQGGEFIDYVGLDNVYSFDGTQATPIGDQPIDGRKRIGARKRILADLATVSPGSVYGYITTAINGSDYNAYWLTIPNTATWMYNHDEQNWTRFNFNKNISTIGRFNKSGIVRIMDLVGRIQDQLWTPATLTGTAPLDGLLLGFNDGTPGYVDFTNYSAQPWSISSGQHNFQDIRHQHNVIKFRIAILDLGQIQFTLTVTGVIYPNPNAVLDNNGQPITTNRNKKTITKVITMGDGSGEELTRVIEVQIPGQYITWSLQGNAGVPASFVEITPIFDIGGEQRGG